MKKMVLLASVVALVALMLAAAPASAQTNDDGDERVLICHTPPPNNFELLIPEDELQGHLGHGDFLGPCDGDRDRDFFDRDFFDRDVVDVVPAIDQDIEQEAESGDVNQSFDVTGGGANSNQTVGIQGTANTGNAQNVIDVVDAGDFVGDFADDGFINGDDDDDCFRFDGTLVCDGVIVDDGNDLDDCFRFDGTLVCDGVIVDDGDDFIDGGFVFGDDDNNVFGDGGNEFEFEEVGSTIDISPTNTVTSNQQVNQAAAASAFDGVVDP